MSKLFQMIALIEQADEHSSNADRALNAFDHEVPGKLVNKHLLRIVEREASVAEFIEHIANSKAFGQEGDYEE